MITKAQVQFIRSLDHKKLRDESGSFIIEGDKLVREALNLPPGSPFKVVSIYGVNSWLASNTKDLWEGAPELCQVSPAELERISFQKNPNQVLAVMNRQMDSTPVFDFSHDLLLGLDQVQDPGNVGTLIRIADWFGVSGIIASDDSADFFSPKVVQASMGSIFRVKLMNMDLAGFIRSAPSGFPVYGTHLEGQNIYGAKISPRGLILLGNESRGLSDELSGLTTMNLRIPDFATGRAKAESLNVSIAGAIFCSEFKRRENAQGS